MENITIKIEVGFESTNKSQQMTIPYDAKVEWIHKEGRLYFAYRIYGRLWTPHIKDIRKFQAIYGVKSYKAISELLKGDTLTMTLSV